MSITSKLTLTVVFLLTLVTLIWVSNQWLAGSKQLHSKDLPAEHIQSADIVSTAMNWKVRKKMATAPQDGAIKEIMERIQRDVVVSGIMMGTHGDNSAFFQIEGQVDVEFGVGDQLMDGFIITSIHNFGVELKNQVGEERFFLSY